MEPELYEDVEYTTAINVYSFTLILYELIVGQPAFPLTLPEILLIQKVIDGERPDVLSTTDPTVNDINQKCWSVKLNERYTFSEILSRLMKIEFKVTSNVDSKLVIKFVQ